jgi:hypothetical protein
MSLEQLAESLTKTGLLVTYRAWPAKEVHEPPFLCYLATGANPTYADGGVYYHYDDVRVELYTALKDQALEAKVEEALSGFHWKKEETYIDTQRCYMIIYEIEV